MGLKGRRRKGMMEFWNDGVLDIKESMWNFQSGYVGAGLRSGLNGSLYVISM